MRTIKRTITIGITFLIVFILTIYHTNNVKDYFSYYKYISKYNHNNLNSYKIFVLINPSLFSCYNCIDNLEKLFNWLLTLNDNSDFMFLVWSSKKNQPYTSYKMIELFINQIGITSNYIINISPKKSNFESSIIVTKNKTIIAKFILPLYNFVEISKIINEKKIN